MSTIPSITRTAALSAVTALALALGAPPAAEAQTRLAFGLGATNMDGATFTLRAITPSQRYGFDWSVGFFAVETGAAFWHMVDLVWVLLFPVVYLL